MQTKKTVGASLREVQLIGGPYLRECFRQDEQTGEIFWKERPREHFCSDMYWKGFNSRFGGKKAGKLCSRGHLTFRITVGDRSLLLKAPHVVWAMHDRTFVEGHLFVHLDGNKLNNKIDNLAHFERGGMMEEVAKQRKKGLRGEREISFQDVVYRSYWSRIVKGAKARGIPVEIDLDDAFSLLVYNNWKCAFTGVKLKFAECIVDLYKDTDLTTASLDRIDSSKGYVLGNIQWIHKDLNKMKMDFEDKKFIEWCIAVAAYRGKSPNSV